MLNDAKFVISLIFLLYLCPVTWIAGWAFAQLPEPGGLLVTFGLIILFWIVVAILATAGFLKNMTKRN